MGTLPKRNFNEWLGDMYYLICNKYGYKNLVNYSMIAGDTTKLKSNDILEKIRPIWNELTEIHAEYMAAKTQLEEDEINAKYFKK